MDEGAKFLGDVRLAAGDDRMSETGDGAAPARDLEAVVDLLYEAVTDSSRWEPFLKACAEAFDSGAASIIITDGRMANGVFSVLYNLDPAKLGRAIQLSHADPRVTYSFERPGQPFSDYRVIPAEDLDNSPMAIECLGPSGMKYTLGVAFVDEETMTAVAVYRSPEARVYDEVETERYGFLVPHLRRAVRLALQFLKLEQEKWTALGVLDSMPMGVAVTDAECHLLHVNTAARLVLDSQDGLLARHGQLWGGTPDLSAELRAAIRRAVEGQAPHQAMAVPRREGSPLQVRIGALRRDSLLAGQPITLAQPVAVLYVTDPDQPQETMRDLLQRLYGLTPREVELAALLAKGGRLDDCATKMDISIPTARTYLRAMFAKTGAATQADLIRLILSAPAWTPPESGNTGE